MCVCMGMLTSLRWSFGFLKDSNVHAVFEITWNESFQMGDTTLQCRTSHNNTRETRRQKLCAILRNLTSVVSVMYVLLFNTLPNHMITCEALIELWSGQIYAYVVVFFPMYISLQWEHLITWNIFLIFLLQWIISCHVLSIKMAAFINNQIIRILRKVAVFAKCEVIWDFIYQFIDAYVCIFVFALSKHRLVS